MSRWQSAETEHASQVALIAWANWNRKRFPCLEYLFAIPNGGKRDPVTARKIRDEGAKPGVPDLFLPCPCAGYSGLWIEMKSRSGTVRPEQQRWHDYLREAGYRVDVCRSTQEAVTAIEDYLG